MIVNIIKKMRQMVSVFLINLKIRQKLLLSYFVLIIIPLGLFTMISYVRVSEVVQNQTKHSATQVFDQASFFLSSKIDNMINTSDLIILDNEIESILNSNLEDYEIAKQLKDVKKMKDFFRNLEKRDIYGIRLFVRDGLVYSDENTNFFNIKALEDDNPSWYKQLNVFNGKILWFPSTFVDIVPPKKEINVISAARLIVNPNHYMENIGVLKIDILQESIQDIINKANIAKTGVVYLANDQGIILSSNSAIANKYRDEAEKYYRNPANSSWNTININDQKVIIGFEQIKNTDWRLVSITPVQEFLASSKSLGNEMILLLLLIGTIAYLAAYYISNSTIKRIAQVIKRMKRVHNGDLDPIIVKHGKDEIGELIQNFNYMIKKMGVLVEEQYKSGQEVKNAELKALQAQINPHFLYNTLDLINWMAIKHKAPDIVFLVNALAKFYKLSLSKGKDIVSISDEIMHVVTYVQIQNKRFDNCINLQLDIDEAMYEYQTLKIILQPIVENAILHGILQKDDKSGTIHITGKLENEVIVLLIRDDGVGMSEGKVQTMFNPSPDDQFHGYGAKNVNDRIKLYFGYEYGVSYQSILGAGTTVEIRIPVMRKE